jgi:predicted metal-dependent hydrolase
MVDPYRPKRFALLSMSEANHQHYLEGIRLFNAGEFWHAHEQWEICWLDSVEPESLFYKGIIQAAAALVHWKKQNPRGLHRNWEKSRPKLAALPAQMKGIDLRALIADMDRFVAADGAGLPAPQLRVVDETATQQ